MPVLSEFSLNHLHTCRTEIVETVELLIVEFDVRVLEGRRSWARQDLLLLEGRTTKKGGESKHNPPLLADGTEDHNWLSNAVDIAPYPIDWNDPTRFIYMAGLIIGIGRARGVNFRWGGNWNDDHIILDQNWNDLPHIEYLGNF